MGAAFSYHCLRQAPAPRRTARFALACCTSLFLHLWLAWELPAGAPRAGRGPAPLAVSLRPAASDASTAPLAVNDVTADTARVPDATSVQKNRPRKRPPTAASGKLGRSQADAHSAGIAAHADPTYYPARELDVYPALLAPLAIRYPERALAENRAGRALVMLLIDAAGKVDDVAIVEADPPGYFEEAARKTLETAAFSPARKNGVPVRSRVLIHIRFDPRARPPRKRSELLWRAGRGHAVG